MITPLPRLIARFNRSPFEETGEKKKELESRRRRLWGLGDLSSHDGNAYGALV